MQKLQKVNLHQNTCEECNMNISALKNGLGIVDFLNMSTLSFRAGFYKSVQKLTENCRTNHFKAILYSLLQAPDVTEYCSKNSGL
jgi:hypothetical protein